MADSVVDSVEVTEAVSVAATEDVVAASGEATEVVSEEATEAVSEAAVADSEVSCKPVWFYDDQLF